MTGSNKDSGEVAIKVDGVSKSFKLPHEKQGSVKGMFVNMFGGKRTYEKQQVLKDISFEIKKGEFFGIVGRNGGGKSTLLKLISQIYTPDKGAISVNGKLVPFIELGVGFNPELSGRDNVYLNGALLGFNHEEMQSMYREIVEFAELGKFMDQKLKNYSSGMQVRLAFSIAIRAKADILVLDEVLAVGDEAFQRKCEDYFEKIKADKSKTIVLVTHSMSSVKRYCDKALLLGGGKIKMLGTPDDVANQYSLDNLNKSNKSIAAEHSSSSKISLSPPITSLSIKPVSSLILDRSEDLVFDVFYTHSDDTPVYLGIGLKYGGVSIMEHNTIGIKPKAVGKNKKKYRYKLPLNRFTNGNFKINATIMKESDKSFLAFTTEEGNLGFVIKDDGVRKGGVLIDKGRWVNG